MHHFAKRFDATHNLYGCPFGLSYLYGYPWAMTEDERENGYFPQMEDRKIVNTNFKSVCSYIYNRNRSISLDNLQGFSADSTNRPIGNTTVMATPTNCDYTNLTETLVVLPIDSTDKVKNFRYTQLDPYIHVINATQQVPDVASTSDLAWVWWNKSLLTTIPLIAYDKSNPFDIAAVSPWAIVGCKNCEPTWFNLEGHYTNSARATNAIRFNMSPRSGRIDVQRVSGGTWTNESNRTGIGLNVNATSNFDYMRRGRKLCSAVGYDWYYLETAFSSSVHPFDSDNYFINLPPTLVLKHPANQAYSFKVAQVGHTIYSA